MLKFRQSRECIHDFYAHDDSGNSYGAILLTGQGNSKWGAFCNSKRVNGIDYSNAYAAMNDMQEMLNIKGAI